jgi:hypothetical protein
MKLTPEQIDQLYTFTRQHYVEWFDVQAELVDHLANAIEAEWQTNPKLSFEEVLSKEFKKFGIFGFMGVVEEKQKFLSKKYESMIWSYYKEFFKLPTILLTLSAIVIAYLISSRWQYGEYFILAALGIIYLWSAFEAISMSVKSKRNQKATGRKWLFESMINNNQFFIFYILSPINLYRGLEYLGHENWTTFYYAFSSIFTVVFALYFYVRIKLVPPLVSQELAKTYPEYPFQHL